MCNVASMQRACTIGTLIRTIGPIRITVRHGRILTSTTFASSIHYPRYVEHAMSHPASTSSRAPVGSDLVSSDPEQSASPGTTETYERSAQEHLIVLVNGLFGSRSNWNLLISLLRSQLDGSTSRAITSTSNEFIATYHGIDVCGRRLAAEIRNEVRMDKRLKRISIIAHSMGGLIARYAIAELFEPTTGLMAGLVPSHFITLATPHVGCSVDAGPAQVPFLGWLPISSVSTAIDPTVTGLVSLVLRRSGAQLFLRDADGEGGLPLLYRLAHDWPEENKLFLSALAAFRTRTAYANRSWDHIVGWANSSLRTMEELPQIELPKGRGVVREDPIEFAWSSDACEELQCAVPSRSITDRVVAGQSLSERKFVGSQNRLLSAMDGTTRVEQYIHASLESLKELSWRRIDVCFGGGVLPLLAHQNLQVQREWLNFDGKETMKHLVAQLQAMENLMISEDTTKIEDLSSY